MKISNSRSTVIDRYPAKMVSRLAVELVQKYARDAESLLDPFCGSGAVLCAAQSFGLRGVGVDINPYATLLSSVKLNGFDGERAKSLFMDVAEKTSKYGSSLPVQWPGKAYWFTPAVMKKIERVRWQLYSRRDEWTPELAAVVLAFALSVRLCSRADLRSPKPFISKTAIAEGRGSNSNLISIMLNILNGLEKFHGRRVQSGFRVETLDMAGGVNVCETVGAHSHVITSPPYVNAQDYFRNFKLELHCLEGLIFTSVDVFKNRFIGTERGVRVGSWATGGSTMVPELEELRALKPRHALIVDRYLSDMTAAFRRVKKCLRPRGMLVLVCGDNLVGGVHLRTWEVIGSMLENMGFEVLERFKDEIACRSLPPKRLGHKGLIKEEVVSVFVLAA